LRGRGSGRTGGEVVCTVSLRHPSPASRHRRARASSIPITNAAMVVSPAKPRLPGLGCVRHAVT